MIDKLENLASQYKELQNDVRKQTRDLVDSLFYAVYHDKLAELSDKQKEVFLCLLIFNDGRIDDFTEHLVDSEVFDEPEAE